MSESAIGLIHEFDARIVVSGMHEVGDGPYGSRRYVEVTEARIRGGRLSGGLLGSAGDWMLVGPDGGWRMDVRLQILMADGAVVCARYFGPAEVNDRVRRAMAAGVPTTFADQRIRTHWLLETGDPRHAWVNHAVLVGEARFRPGEDGSPGYEHRVYRVDRPEG